MDERYKYAAIAATFESNSGSNDDFIKGPNWEPLEDDEEAFDLMVRCQMSVGDYICGDYHDWSVLVSANSRWYDGDSAYERQEFYAKGTQGDCRAAFREAIVNVAAKLGKHYVEEGYYEENKNDISIC